MQDAAGDPRLADRFEVVDHPITGPVREVRAPFVVDGQPTTTQRRAPLFDEHTDEVLGAVLDADVVDRLRTAGVIGGTLLSPAEYGL